VLVSVSGFNCVHLSKPVLVESIQTAKILPSFTKAKSSVLTEVNAANSSCVSTIVIFLLIASKDTFPSEAA
jgi:hypothetical protein